MIPASEINWLYKINEKYRVQTPTGYIYNVDILPPILGKWVKEKSRDTEYINFGPFMGIPGGMKWAIWGWHSLPKSSALAGSDWQSTIDALD